jgi:DNA-binding response OmpR family regulator
MLAWRTDPAPQVLIVCGVEIDVLRRRVRVDGRNVGQLTDREFRLLHFLASNAGIVFTREKLLARLWRRDSGATARSVDAMIKRLRRRLEPDLNRRRYLLTVWGVGYIHRRRLIESARRYFCVPSAGFIWLCCSMTTSGYAQEIAKCVGLLLRA